MASYIYTLSDPRTGLVRYVGKTKNPKERFKNHRNKDHNKRSHKRNWINLLRNLKLTPVFEIIDIVPDEDWRFWEVYWIGQFKSWGFDLVNHTAGGDGLTEGNQTSFRKGNISWNTGKGNIENCATCGKQFKTSKASVKQGRKNCSKECAKKWRDSHPNKGVFKNGLVPWNKSNSGYKIFGLKKSKPVIQLTLQGEYIREHLGCKEAAEFVGCIPENIRRCCVGKSKTARKFKWKYK